MNLRYFNFIGILIITCLLSCRESPPQLEIARNIYKNNLNGVELFEALDAEQKLLVKKCFNKKHYDNSIIIDVFNGIANRMHVPVASENVRRVTKYYKKNSDTLNHSMTYKKLRERKAFLKNSFDTFDKDGKPSQINSKKIEYKDDKVKWHGKKEHTYSENGMKISWYDHFDNHIEERYELYGRTLKMQEFKNNAPTIYKSQTVFNYDNQVIKRNSANSIGIENHSLNFTSSIEYDNSKRIKRSTHKQEDIIDGEPYSKSKPSTFIYTYNRIGLIETRERQNKFPGIDFKKYIYSYSFFKDKEGLLNVYKLICSPLSGPKKGELVHYIFDDHSNLLYYHSTNFRNNTNYFYFKEYEYY